jgi:hypothetical protein
VCCANSSASAGVVCRAALTYFALCVCVCVCACACACVRVRACACVNESNTSSTHSVIMCFHRTSSLGTMLATAPSARPASGAPGVRCQQNVGRWCHRRCAKGVNS